MCRQNYLLSSRRLPTVQDDPEFPSLSVAEVWPGSQVCHTIRTVALAAFVYRVGPTRLCGCYFSYEDRSSREHANEDKARSAANAARYGVDPNAWVDQESRDAVASLGRYVTRHVSGCKLALYVAWENMEGAELVRRETVTPAFFGGPSFGPLDEDTLLTIVAGGAGRRRAAP